MNFRLRPLLASLAFAVLPALAHAHPGHDGHDFGWDFSGSPAHFVASVAYFVALIGSAVLVVQLLTRSRKSSQQQERSKSKE